MVGVLSFVKQLGSKLELELSNKETLISRLELLGFKGEKLDKVWPTVLALKRSGLSDDSIVRCILDEFRYLL